jgi:hypothetical protein
MNTNDINNLSKLTNTILLKEEDGTASHSTHSTHEALNQAYGLLNKLSDVLRKISGRDSIEVALSTQGFVVALDKLLTAPVVHVLLDRRERENIHFNRNNPPIV